MIADSLAHPPPTSGAYSYTSYRGPARGGSLIDPVFGTYITRLTSEHPAASSSDLYSKNGFWNSNGTRMAHATPTGLTIIDTDDGSVVRSGVPGNFDCSFAPDHYDLLYYFDGPRLQRYSVGRGETLPNAVNTFSADLGPLGGSLDWIDATGQYMVLNIGGQGRVWDRRASALYAGAIPGDAGDGWLAMSPDGRYVVTTIGKRLPSGQPITSYAIDHDRRTIATKGVMFWSLDGDHGDLASVDGKTYFLTHEAHSEPGIWAVDVSIPQWSTPAGLVKQRHDNRKLVALDWKDNDGHISCGGEWAYVSVESVDDPFGGGVTNWRPYKQEILRVHVITGEIQRLAHHRSRGLGGDTNYRWQPRVCASWDGSRVAWASNMGANVEGAADLFTINLGASVPPPPPIDPPPVPLADTESFRITIGGKSATFKRTP